MTRWPRRPVATGATATRRGRGCTDRRPDSAGTRRHSHPSLKKCGRSTPRSALSARPTNICTANGTSSSSRSHVSSAVTASTVRRRWSVPRAARREQSGRATSGDRWAAESTRGSASTKPGVRTTTRGHRQTADVRRGYVPFRRSAGVASTHHFELEGRHEATTVAPKPPLAHPASRGGRDGSRPQPSRLLA